jgi:hypothetical protein
MTSKATKVGRETGRRHFFFIVVISNSYKFFWALIHWLELTMTLRLTRRLRNEGKQSYLVSSVSATFTAKTGTQLELV